MTRSAIDQPRTGAADDEGQWANGRRSLLLVVVGAWHSVCALTTGEYEGREDEAQVYVLRSRSACRRTVLNELSTATRSSG